MTEENSHTRFNAPYWHVPDGHPGADYCREVIQPGVDPCLPDGAVGIRVDDDFWLVAVLPLEPYADESIQSIVADVWPHLADEATYVPDHGTKEQEIHFLHAALDTRTKMFDALWDEHCEMMRELRRYQIQLPEIKPRSRKRHEVELSWSRDQYERMLVTFAHSFEPKSSPEAGVCSRCGLLGSDRVHQPHWIEKREREGLDVHGLPAMCMYQSESKREDN